VDIIKKIAPYIEIIAALNLAVVLALSTAENNLSFLLIISTSILSLLYVITARIYLFDKGLSWAKRLVSFFNYTGIAITLMGVLFAFNHYPGYLVMIKAGPILVILSMIGIILFKKDNTSDLFEFKLPLIRSAIALLLALIFLI
jgi:hypothetical protein